MEGHSNTHRGLKPITPSIAGEAGEKSLTSRIIGSSSIRLPRDGGGVPRKITTTYPKLRVVRTFSERFL
jgi:hypothetical protein